MSVTAVPIQPIKKVDVGTQVNGRLLNLYVDFNSIVTAGQVVAQIPHWTQLRSMNLSCGFTAPSPPSISADSGHAPAQARHMVHLS